MPDTFDVTSALAGERVFITGATGFLGKVLVEKLLWSVPEIGGLALLVRPDGVRSAEERLREDLFASPVFARLRARHGERFDAWVGGKVEAVAGDLGADGFGLQAAAYRGLCERVDRVVACAATVTFDERLDRALSLNARGALRALELARDAGGAPLVHVSTCFVSGRRTGPVAEEPPLLGADGDADPDAVLADLDATCAAQAEDGAEGDAPWVAAGAEAAARHGFHDVYTLTKALGERLVERRRGAVPVAIVRPAIVESATAEPFAGWMEGVKVVDPLLVAYGRGRTRVLPGAPGVAMELVPVDHVVAVLVAALADLGRGGDRLRIFQVGSSRHPITLGELIRYARRGFRATPLRDEEGEPIAVRRARFMAPDRLRARLVRRLAAARRKGDAVGERTLEHFVRLIDVYRPYVTAGASYADERTRALRERLSPASRAAFPFDVTAIDWPSWVARVHVPGLVRFALRAESGAPVPEELPPAAERHAAAAERVAAARTLFELFESVARAHPEVMALQTHRDGRWLRYTYAEALAATANVAWRLATEHGVRPGDRVVLWSSGRPEWALAALAVHRLGAAVVPLDPQWPAAEALAAARFVDARVALAMPPLVPALRAAQADEPGGRPLPVAALAAPFVPQPEVGLLPQAAGHAARRVGGEDDLASILFTSGTTRTTGSTAASAAGALPKAVPLSHGNYLANVRDLVPIMRLSRERLLSVLPVHHAFEQTVGFLVPVAGASTVSYVAELRPQEISWMMSTTRPTMLVAVPRLLELLHGGIMANVEANGLDRLFKVLFALSRATGARLGHKLFAKVHRRFGGALRRIATGGSALRPGLGRSFQLMGFEVAEGYGMTETAPVLTVNPWGRLRFGSVGRPLPGVEIELRPPVGPAAEALGRGLAPGEGEVWVRGGNVMRGYYRNPEATAAVMRDGWLNTGDVGRFDADGYLHLSGRTKEVIVTAAGKNVYPEEVELRYRGLAGVEELVVLGLPGRGAAEGEVVAAVVVPAAGADAAAVRAAVDRRGAEVPSYQRITRLEVWRGELPKTTTLKVQRARLAAAILAGERGGTAKAAPAPPARVEPPRSEGEEWAIATVARLTRSRADQLAQDDRLADLGVDSLTRVELVGEIEGRRGGRLDESAVARLERVRDVSDLA